MKTKILYLAIVLVTIFSPIACSSDVVTTCTSGAGNESIFGQDGLILLLGAFGQEIDGLRRKLDVDKVTSERGYELYCGNYENRDILLVRTGMGKKRAENATESVLGNYPVTAIVSLGFAGGLNPELEIGDVVLCSTLYCENGSDQENPEAAPLSSDANLTALASESLEEIKVNYHIGTCVSVLELESDLERQQELAETFNADMVEMESYWIAKIAADHEIPFIAIRSMSDSGNDIQPFDEILSEEGDLLWDEAIVSFTLHPQYLFKVFNLYLNVRVAHENLTACVLNLLPKM